jgi:hypothetical protein
VSAPEVVLITRAVVRRLDDGRPIVHEQFEVRGGDVAPEWATTLRPPAAPWCEVTIWNEEPAVSTYGGEVWPGAWPVLFRFEGPRGRQAILLTDTGIAAFAAARSAGPVSP